MEYHFINENNEQIGPLTMEQLKTENIKKTTKVWTEGMKDWENADTIQELNSLFVSPPPLPSNIPPPIPKKEQPILNTSQSIPKKEQPPLNISQSTPKDVQKPLNVSSSNEKKLPIENMTLDEKIENGICPITGQTATTTIKIYSWYVLMIYLSMQRIEIPVSNKGKELHNNQRSGLWKIITPGINFFSYIPFIGAVFGTYWVIILFSILFIPFLIIDASSGKNIYGKGIVQIQGENIVITN